MRRAISPSNAPAPKGPYSLAILASGRMLYVSGQGPVDPVTQQFVYGTFDEQVTLTLRNLRSIVEAAGGSLANAVKVNVFLRDMANFDRLNAIYPDFFPEPHPARTTCQSALPGFEVEIDCIVALGED